MIFRSHNRHLFGLFCAAFGLFRAAVRDHGDSGLRLLFALVGDDQLPPVQGGVIRVGKTAAELRAADEANAVLRPGPPS